MHTRSPDVRRPPKKYDDFEYKPSPASSSPTENSAREKIGAVPRNYAQQQQLKSPSPPKRVPRRNRNVYLGPVIPFTPHLSSTDSPRDGQARSNTTPDQELTLSASGSDEQEETVHQPLEHSRREDSQHLPNMFSVPANAATAGPGPRQRPTITVSNTTASRAGANLRGQGLGPNDNGPNNPIYMRNMQLMEEWAGMTDFDREMEAMKDSDEDEPQATVAQEFPQAVSDDSPPPSWDDLGIAVKLDVADTVNGLYDAPPEMIMNALRLNDSEKDDLTRLLIQRTERQAEEDRNARLLRDHQREILLKGGNISSEENQNMMNRTIYRSAGEENFVTATRAEVIKAKRYLQHIGFDPSILVWCEPQTGAPFSQNDHDATITAGLEESSNSDGEQNGSSPRPERVSAQARAPPPQPYAESALPKTKDAQEKEKKSRTSSHRPPKISELIHVHSSPVAPHTVPSRSFPVASAHRKTQQPVGPVPLPSQHNDRGRSLLRTNDMPPGQKYNSQSHLPTPPTEPFRASATGRLPTRPAPVAPMNSNNDAADPHGGGVRNKRKRSSGGGPGDGAGRSEAHLAGTIDHHSTLDVSSTSATRKTKKSGGNQG